MAKNTTLYSDYFMHPRSIDGRYHESRDWVKGWWAERAHLLAPKLRICGENMFAQHSIVYNELESYFYGFSVWEGDWCLPWDETQDIFQQLDIVSVPELWRGQCDLMKLVDLGEALDPNTQEGYVVRVTDGYLMAFSHLLIAKYVRAGHVQTDEFWMHSELKPNGLAK